MATTNEGTLREEITRVEQSLYAHDYTVDTVGGTGARLPDGWLITPTDAYLDTLDPARIAKVLATGGWVNGGKPSKALALHHGIYDRNTETHTVVHTHPTHLAALVLAGVWHEAGVLPPIMPYYVMKVDHVPLIAYRRPGHPDMAVRAAALVDDVCTMLLDRLGPMVWHGSVSTTTYTLEELEGAARLWLMTEPKPASLSDAQIDELR